MKIPSPQLAAPGSPRMMSTTPRYNCTCLMKCAILFVFRSDGLSASNILGLNKKYLDQLTSYLKPVLQSSSSSRFMRCWHAKTDGWAASTFHRQCDNKGPTVTIIKVNNYIFGGYTDVSWSGKPHLLQHDFYRVNCNC